MTAPGINSYSLTELSQFTLIDKPAWEVHRNTEELISVILFYPVRVEM